MASTSAAATDYDVEPASPSSFMRPFIQDGRYTCYDNAGCDMDDDDDESNMDSLSTLRDDTEAFLSIDGYDGDGDSDEYGDASYEGSYSTGMGETDHDQEDYSIYSDFSVEELHEFMLQQQQQSMLDYAYSLRRYSLLETIHEETSEELRSDSESRSELSDNYSGVWCWGDDFTDGAESVIYVDDTQGDDGNDEEDDDTTNSSDQTNDTESGDSIGSLTAVESSVLTILAEDQQNPGSKLQNAVLLQDPSEREGSWLDAEAEPDILEGPKAIDKSDQCSVNGWDDAFPVDDIVDNADGSPSVRITNTIHCSISENHSMANVIDKQGIEAGGQHLTPKKMEQLQPEQTEHPVLCKLTSEKSIIPKDPDENGCGDNDLAVDRPTTPTHLLHMTSSNPVQPDDQKRSAVDSAAVLSYLKSILINGDQPDPSCYHALLQRHLEKHKLQLTSDSDLLILFDHEDENRAATSRDSGDEEFLSWSDAIDAYLMSLATDQSEPRRIAEGSNKKSCHGSAILGHDLRDRDEAVSPLCRGARTAHIESSSSFNKDESPIDFEGLVRTAGDGAEEDPLPICCETSASGSYRGNAADKQVRLLGVKSAPDLLDGQLSDHDEDGVAHKNGFMFDDSDKISISPVKFSLSSEAEETYAHKCQSAPCVNSMGSDEDAEVFDGHVVAPLSGKSGSGSNFIFGSDLFGSSSPLKRQSSPFGVGNLSSCQLDRGRFSKSFDSQFSNSYGGSSSCSSSSSEEDEEVSSSSDEGAESLSQSRGSLSRFPRFTPPGALRSFRSFDTLHLAGQLEDDPIRRFSESWMDGIEECSEREEKARPSSENLSEDSGYCESKTGILSLLRAPDDSKMALNGLNPASEVIYEDEVISDEQADSKLCTTDISLMESETKAGTKMAEIGTYDTKMETSGLNLASEFVYKVEVGSNEHYNSKLGTTTISGLESELEVGTKMAAIETCDTKMAPSGLNPVTEFVYEVEIDSDEQPNSTLDTTNIPLLESQLKIGTNMAAIGIYDTKMAPSGLNPAKKLESETKMAAIETDSTIPAEDARLKQLLRSDTARRDRVQTLSLKGSSTFGHSDEIGSTSVCAVNEITLSAHDQHEDEFPVAVNKHREQKNSGLKDEENKMAAQEEEGVDLTRTPHIPVKNSTTNPDGISPSGQNENLSSDVITTKQGEHQQNVGVAHTKFTPEFGVHGCAQTFPQKVGVNSCQDSNGSGKDNEIQTQRSPDHPHQAKPFSQPLSPIEKAVSCGTWRVPHVPPPLIEKFGETCIEHTPNLTSPIDIEAAGSRNSDGEHAIVLKEPVLNITEIGLIELPVSDVTPQEFSTTQKTIQAFDNQQYNGSTTPRWLSAPDASEKDEKCNKLDVNIVEHGAGGAVGSHSIIIGKDRMENSTSIIALEVLSNDYELDNIKVELKTEGPLLGDVLVNNSVSVSVVSEKSENFQLPTSFEKKNSLDDLEATPCLQSTNIESQGPPTICLETSDNNSSDALSVSHNIEISVKNSEKSEKFAINGATGVKSVGSISTPRVISLLQTVGAVEDIGVPTITSISSAAEVEVGLFSVKKVKNNENCQQNLDKKCPKEEEEEEEGEEREKEEDRDEECSSKNQSVLSQRALNSAASAFTSVRNGIPDGIVGTSSQNLPVEPEEPEKLGYTFHNSQDEKVGVIYTDIKADTVCDAELIVELIDKVCDKCQVVETQFKERVRASIHSDKKVVDDVESADKTSQVEIIWSSSESEDEENSTMSQVKSNKIKRHLWWPLKNGSSKTSSTPKSAQKNGGDSNSKTLDSQKKSLGLNSPSNHHNNIEDWDPDWIGTSIDIDDVVPRSTSGQGSLQMPMSTSGHGDRQIPQKCKEHTDIDIYKPEISTSQFSSVRDNVISPVKTLGLSSYKKNGVTPAGKPPLPPHRQHRNQLAHQLPPCRAKIINARQHFFVKNPEATTPTTTTAVAIKSEVDSNSSEAETDDDTTSNIDPLIDIDAKHIDVLEALEQFRQRAREGRDRVAKTVLDLNQVERAVRIQQQQQQELQQQSNSIIDPLFCSGESSNRYNVKDIHCSSSNSSSSSSAVKKENVDFEKTGLFDAEDGWNKNVCLDGGDADFKKDLDVCACTSPPTSARRVSATSGYGGTSSCWKDSNQSIGYLETDIDTLQSREVIRVPDSPVKERNYFYGSIRKHRPYKLKTQSMFNLTADEENMSSADGSAVGGPIHGGQTVGNNHHHLEIGHEDSASSRAKSMEFLLKDENKAAVLPPENQLQHQQALGGVDGHGVQLRSHQPEERVLSEHELRIRRSLQKLNLPEWYTSSPISQMGSTEGFILKKDPAQQTSGSRLSGPRWEDIRSRSSSNLGGSGLIRNTTPQPSSASKNVIISKRVTTPDLRYVKSSRESLLQSPLSPSPSPSPKDKSPYFQYSSYTPSSAMSRWSSSRLSCTTTSSRSTSPTGSLRSPFQRQPYLGWRSSERLAREATNCSTGNSASSTPTHGFYRSAAERLSQGPGYYALRFGSYRVPGSESNLAQGNSRRGSNTSTATAPPEALGAIPSPVSATLQGEMTSYYSPTENSHPEITVNVIEPNGYYETHAEELQNSSDQKPTANENAGQMQVADLVREIDKLIHRNGHVVETNDDQLQEITVLQEDAPKSEKVAISPKSVDRQKFVWMESSFVGVRPIVPADSPTMDNSRISPAHMSGIKGSPKDRSPKEVSPPEKIISQAQVHPPPPALFQTPSLYKQEPTDRRLSLNSTTLEEVLDSLLALPSSSQSPSPSGYRPSKWETAEVESPVTNKDYQQQQECAEEIPGPRTDYQQQPCDENEIRVLEKDYLDQSTADVVIPNLTANYHQVETTVPIQDYQQQSLAEEEILLPEATAKKAILVPTPRPEEVILVPETAYNEVISVIKSENQHQSSTELAAEEAIVVPGTAAKEVILFPKPRAEEVILLPETATDKVIQVAKTDNQHQSFTELATLVQMKDYQQQVHAEEAIAVLETVAEEVILDPENTNRQQSFTEEAEDVTPVLMSEDRQRLVDDVPIPEFESEVPIKTDHSVPSSTRQSEQESCSSGSEAGSTGSSNASLSEEHSQVEGEDDGLDKGSGSSGSDLTTATTTVASGSSSYRLSGSASTSGSVSGSGGNSHSSSLSASSSASGSGKEVIPPPPDFTDKPSKSHSVEMPPLPSAPPEPQSESLQDRTDSRDTCATAASFDRTSTSENFSLHQSPSSSFACEEDSATPPIMLCTMPTSTISNGSSQEDDDDGTAITDTVIADEVLPIPTRNDSFPPPPTPEQFEELQRLHQSYDSDVALPLSDSFSSSIGLPGSAQSSSCDQVIGAIEPIPDRVEGETDELQMASSFVVSSEIFDEEAVDNDGEVKSEVFVDDLIDTTCSAREGGTSVLRENNHSTASDISLQTILQGMQFEEESMVSENVAQLRSLDTSKEEEVVPRDRRSLRSDLMMDDTVIVRCSHDQCKKTAELRDARKTYKTCHNCYTYYCSRECRKDHWVRHRRVCMYGRIRSMCKQAIQCSKENPSILLYLSKLARTGYITQGRGFVKIVFRNTDLAIRFLRQGWPLMEDGPMYVNWRDLIPQEMGDEVYRAVVDLCQRYDPETKFVLLVAIFITREVPVQSVPHWEREVIAKCAKLSISKFVGKDGHGFLNEDPNTLILTGPQQIKGADVASSRKAREVCLVNIQEQLRERGVSLRHQFPEAYSRLCSYVDNDDPFPPLTIYPKDGRTGNTFMCVIMPNSGPQLNEWLISKVK